jgi:hypothetical protein
MRALAILAMTMLPMPAAADLPPARTELVGAFQVTIHTYAFLTAEEVATLELVLTNEDALALFVPDEGGHAALAVAPDEGFLRDGTLVPSAVALAGLPDPGAAAEAARTACDAARDGGAPCIVVLEVAPAP